MQNTDGQKTLCPKLVPWTNPSPQGQVCGFWMQLLRAQLKEMGHTYFLKRRPISFEVYDHRSHKMLQWITTFPEFTWKLVCIMSATLNFHCLLIADYFVTLKFHGWDTRSLYPKQIEQLRSGNKMKWWNESLSDMSMILKCGSNFLCSKIQGIHPPTVKMFRTAKNKDRLENLHGNRKH